MGNRKALLPVSMALSALSALAGMLPYILIWFIVRELLAPGETIVSGNIETYAWWAAGLAVGSVILYFAALMASHLAAFRVESNLRREAMRKIVQMPLGFFDYNTSGRIRKIIDDNAGITHSFLAHQMPDLAATFLVPLVAAILIFSFRPCLHGSRHYIHDRDGIHDGYQRTAIHAKLHDRPRRNEHGGRGIRERNSRGESFPANHLLVQELSQKHQKL